jgi:hypothetical protein
MAQDPEGDEQPESESSERTGEVDLSHDLDLVAIYSSQTVDAEIECDVIHSLLEANGVPNMVVGFNQFPAFAFEVRVPRARVEEATRLIAEAEAAGPEAAAEGEAASEQGRE